MQLSEWVSNIPMTILIGAKEPIIP